jgi:hypothetical protein
VSLLEQQKTLARLLTDPLFRERFLADPNLNGQSLGLSKAETDELVRVADRDLPMFAESLVWKRLKEVEKLLPLTGRIAGEGFRRLFFEFAPTFNSQAIRKHKEDAVHFCRFIEERHRDGPLGDAARFERTRLTFFNEERRLAFCRSLYDLSTPARDNAGSTRKGRTAVAVWIRPGKKRVFHFVI